MPGPRIADRLQAVRETIATACVRSGRPESAVRLIAVSKNVELELVAAAVRCGQWELGENRVQDAIPRQAALSALLAAAGLDPAALIWHFIGHLQGNKVNRAAGRFALLHGVDSLALAERLSRRCLETSVTQPLLLEVNISGEAQKNGVVPAELPALAAAVADLPGVDLQGLMGMARHGASAAELAATFGRLRLAGEAARRESGLPLPELSMGMSDDFDAAIAEGATMIRVGSAIFDPAAG